MEHVGNNSNIISLDTGFKKSDNFVAFKEGVIDGVPIGMGYFAVAFSLGIAARNADINAIQGFIASLFTLASAGQFAVFQLIADHALYWQIALAALVTNLRYMLMGCALSQKIDKNVGIKTRLLLGLSITDEVFGISISRHGKLNPFYSIGAIAFAAPCWAAGTMLGILMGKLLPANIVSALGVALYGMFLAVIVPPAKKDKILAGLILCSFAASYVFNYFSDAIQISGGNIIIILTVVISAIAAVLFPVKEEENNG